MTVLYKGIPMKLFGHSTYNGQFGTYNSPRKYVFLPAKIEFLGFLLDSETITISLTCEKADKFVTLCNKLLLKCEITIRDFAQVIGKLVASQHGVKFAPLFLKDLEHEKRKSSKKCKRQLGFKNNFIKEIL